MKLKNDYFSAKSETINNHINEKTDHIIIKRICS
jgi:hypothetical protein